MKWTEIMCISVLDFRFKNVKREMFFKKGFTTDGAPFRRLKLADKEEECRLLKLVPGGVIQEH